MKRGRRWSLMVSLLVSAGDIMFLGKTLNSDSACLRPVV